MKQRDMISRKKWSTDMNAVEKKHERKIVEQGFTFQVRLLDLKCKKLA